MIITIDGPSVSGKSSVAAQIALRLGMSHFSTGLLYRAVAYIALDVLHETKSYNHGFDLASISFNFISEISCMIKNQAVSIFFQQVDITPFLTNDQLSLPASAFSALPQVRERLLDVQREIGRRYDIVVDGRDCGSVVFPQADFKFFLTASVDARVQRIMNDPRRATVYRDYEHARDELLKRDEQDSKRTLAPLIVPQGAVVVDNSDLNLEQTIEKFLEVIQKK